MLILNDISESAAMEIMFSACDNQFNAWYIITDTLYKQAHILDHIMKRSNVTKRTVLNTVVWPSGSEIIVGKMQHIKGRSLSGVYISPNVKPSDRKYFMESFLPTLHRSGIVIIGKTNE